MRQHCVPRYLNIMGTKRKGGTPGWQTLAKKIKEAVGDVNTMMMNRPSLSYTHRKWYLMVLIENGPLE